MAQLQKLPTFEGPCVEWWHTIDTSAPLHPVVRKSCLVALEARAEALQTVAGQRTMMRALLMGQLEVETLQISAGPAKREAAKDTCKQDGTRRVDEGHNDESMNTMIVLAATILRQPCTKPIPV